MLGTAALLGSGQVASRYEPIVNTGTANPLLNRAGSPIAVADGLPTAEDTEDKLCRKAGEAVGSVLTMAVPLPESLSDAISGMFGRLVAAGGAYFCEIGTGGGPPDVSNELNQERKTHVTGARWPPGDAAQARQRYDDQCTTYDCLNTTPTAAQRRAERGSRA